jgi:hypothetical protein
VLLPALVARELCDVARSHHDVHPEGASAERIVGWLGAFIPRVMSPESLDSAARHAGAEPLWTGRQRAYSESALRQAAARLDTEGAWVHVARAVWTQVDDVVTKVDDEVIAYTDMFDQPYYTKKLAHAAPIGRLGNRLLACAYFGLTTITLPQGPTLFVHLSWHKPAAPLRDGLEELFEDEARMAWWHEHVRLHIVDRGANGDPVLSWMWAWGVPYLTVGRKGAELWRFRTPTLRNKHALPFVVRPDTRLGGDAEDGPWEMIVPAHPNNPNATRGIRFRSAVAFSNVELLTLNALYKSRWPCMENKIKALQSQGFGRNRTRRLELMVSRGTDGKLAKSRERVQRLTAQSVQLQALSASRKNLSRLAATKKSLQKEKTKQATIENNATLKHARVVGGAERLGKWLHLLVHNAVALALVTSPVEEVHGMDPATVSALLLRRSATTRIEAGRLTMWVDALNDVNDRRRQVALVEVFNKLGLRCRGCTVVIHLNESAVRKAS